MFTRRRLFDLSTRVTSCAFAVGLLACSAGGDGEGSAPDDGPGVRHPAHAGSTGGSGGAANGGTPGSAGVGSGGSAGSVPDPDGGPGGPPVIPSDPDFDGVDTSTVPTGTAPEGCIAGFDTQAKSLRMTLGNVHTVLISAVEGELQVNGVTCTAADGTPVTADSIVQVEVEGTPQDDTIIVDESTGSLGQILSGNGGFILSLSDGYDALVLRGTRQDDTYWAGALEEELIVDMNGDATGDLRCTGMDHLTVSLGPGDDVLTTAEGGEEAEFEAPMVSFSVYGGDGNDILEGSARADTLFGGMGNDVISGGDGNDWFDARTEGDGMDIFNGGGGSDTVSYVDRTQRVQITMCMSSATRGCSPAACACEANDGQEGEGDTVVNMEHAHGGAGNDTLQGDGADNHFYGHDGDDLLVGGDGNDFLYGDFGDDDLQGGAGDDFLDGSFGEDRIDGGESTGDICIVDDDEPATSCELY